jgi:quercetin dioxygenase-like cupin family protein
MADFLQLENRHTGEILRIRRVRDGEGRLILELDGTLPPGADGPPPHIHFHEDESGLVKAGTLAARVGGQTIRIPTGGTVKLPKGIVHNWWNGGEDLLRFAGQVTPAVDLDRYLQGIFAVINAGPPGRPPIFYIAHVLWRHRETQAMAVPPRPIQKILFPLIVFLGNLLGKYKGDDWPGSPARCPGAPTAAN